MHAPSDISRSQLLLQSSQRLSSVMNAASQELTSGQRAQAVTAERPDGAALHLLQSHKARLNTDIQSIDAYQRRADVATNTLAALTEALAPIGGDLLSAVMAEDGGRTRAVSSQAEEALALVWGGMGSAHSGRAIFGGNQPGLPVLPGLEVMLNDLSVQVHTGGQEPQDAISAYFAPGGRFETEIWQGGVGADPTQLAAGHPVPSLPTGLDPAFLETLAALSSIVLASDGGFDDEAIKQLRLSGAEGVISGQTALIELTASIGGEQGRLQRIHDILTAEAGATELVLNDAMAADPYEAAVRLNEAQASLEALFTVTARLSSLTLSRFLS